MMISASNAWVAAYDNLSGLPPHLSDALCSLATGGGFAARQLHTDDDEKLFSATRPILLNGIDDLAGRPDLTDRAIALTLLQIPDEQRRDEKKMLPEFEAIRPRVLGALLDAMSCALRNQDSVSLSALPRMADFATWVSAAEPALPWAAGDFLRAYSNCRAGANAVAVESSPVGPSIESLMGSRASWEGTARELLTAIEDHADEKAVGRRDWPGNARLLSVAVRRIAPNLRAAGIAVESGRESSKRRRRIIRLERTADAGPGEVGRRNAAPDAGQPVLRPTENGDSGLSGPIADAGPQTDAEIPLLSCSGPEGPADGVQGGWPDAAWADNLKRMASACEAEHPDRAAELRARARALDLPA